MIRLVIIILSVIFVIYGCEKGETNVEKTCNFTSFYYYKGNQNLLGEMSGEYLLIGSDTTNEDIAISAFIKI